MATSLSVLMEARLERLRRLMDNPDWIFWHSKIDRLYYALNAQKHRGHACRNFWEMFAWCRIQKEKENGEHRDAETAR